MINRNMKKVFYTTNHQGEANKTLVSHNFMKNIPYEEYKLVQSRRFLERCK